MGALIIESTDSANLKLISELAQKLGSTVKTITDKEIANFESNVSFKESLPGFVVKGIEKGLEDVNAGRLKSLEEVKVLMAKR